MSDLNDDEFELGIPIEDESESSDDKPEDSPGKQDDLTEANSQPDADFQDEPIEEDHLDLGIEIDEKKEVSDEPLSGEDGEWEEVTGVYEGNEPVLLQTSVVEAFGEKLDGITAKINDLKGDFHQKLKNDAHKNKLIDSLHNELQVYKNDLVSKHVQSMIMDLIKVIDDIRRLSEHYQSLNPNELEPEKLLQLLKRIPDDLEDLCSYQGVKPFTCKGAGFDPTRQRVLKKVETTEPHLEKTVAESLRKGYEWNDKVIRPEFVSVYLYQKPSNDEEIGNSDE